LETLTIPSTITLISGLAFSVHEIELNSYDGIAQFRVKLLPQNADFSSRDNFESAQNEIDVSDVHSEKQDSQIMLIPESIINQPLSNRMNIEIDNDGMAQL
jgi:hypothetical protein